MPTSDLKDIFPLLTAGIAAISTLLAVAITSFFNLRVARINIEKQAQNKTKEIKLQRIEELFYLFEKWHAFASNIDRNFVSLFKGDITIEQLSEMANKTDMVGHGEYQRFTMIAELHFPSLNAPYAQIEAVLKRKKPFYTNPLNDQIIIKDFEDCMKDFNIACAAYRSQVKSIAHDILADDGNKISAFKRFMMSVCDENTDKKGA